MGDSYTTRLSLIKPEIGMSFNTWGHKWHQALDDLDEYVGAFKRNQLAGEPEPGLLVALSDGTFVRREIVAENARGLSVTNGDGITNNPTLQLNPNNLTSKTAPTDTDIMVVGDASSSFVPRKSTRRQFLSNATLVAPKQTFENRGLVSTFPQHLDLKHNTLFRMEIAPLVSMYQPRFANRPTDDAVVFAFVDVTIPTVQNADPDGAFAWQDGGTYGPVLDPGRYLIMYMVYPDSSGVVDGVGIVLASNIA